MAVTKLRKHSGFLKDCAFTGMQHSKLRLPLVNRMYMLQVKFDFRLNLFNVSDSQFPLSPGPNS